MSLPVSASANGALVVTQVYHPFSQHVEQQVCVGTQKFSRAYPLALGTAQIMIGVMVLLFGVVMVINADSSAVYSGIFVWGAMLYITSGSLAVAAGKSFSRCLINTALGFNVVACLCSVAATILHSLDAGLMFYCYDHDSWYFSCYRYQSRMQGFSGVLAVFHLLQFIISVTIAIFACKATCNCNDQQPSVYIIPGNASLATQAPPTSYVSPVSMVQPPPQVVRNPKPANSLPEPPAYSS